MSGHKPPGRFWFMFCSAEDLEQKEHVCFCNQQDRGSTMFRDDANTEQAISDIYN